MERDTQLDLYRGLSMIYVVCFIHVIYWLKLGFEPLNSLMLFEMPIIFFISGASLSINRKSRNLKKTVWNRLKRVVIPYYIYAFVMVAILVLLSIGSHYKLFDFLYLFGEDVPARYVFDVSSYSFRNVCSILLFHNIPQLPFVNHLWFIVPYLVLSCTFEFQKRVLTKVNGGGTLRFVLSHF